MTDDNTTHFGYESVNTQDKARRVADVFHSVSKNYDLMNDLMSFGLHRLWKHITLNLADIRKNQTVLDVAGGTGDLAARISSLIGPKGKVILSDINASMLALGRDRLIDEGHCANTYCVQANAEQLPFSEDSFDRIFIGFGLRNVTDKLAALKSMYACTKPSGRLLVLEFSKPTHSLIKKFYDSYSFKFLPKMGQWIAKDSDAYQYLAESIRMHPDQETLKGMMEEAGFERCDYQNLTGGIVAIHRGFKL